MNLPVCEEEDTGGNITRSIYRSCVLVSCISRPIIMMVQTPKRDQVLAGV